MKVLIFAMDTPDAVRDCDDITRTFSAAGHRCVRALYWTSDYFPKKSFLSLAIPTVTLLDGGFPNAPRLTAQDYLHAGGAITDFADLALHDAGTRGWPLTEEMLSLESIYYQRLRGIAIKARSLLRSVEPDLVVVPQGAEPVSRAIAIETAAMNIPLLISESSFFPGFINLDVGGQHFFRGLSRIDRELPGRLRIPLSSPEANRVSTFVQDWSGRNISKYEQRSAQSELEKVRACAADGARHIVFLPGQVPVDANVLPGLRSYASLRELYAAAISVLGNDWRVVVKAHPKDQSGSLRALAALPNTLLLEDISIHDLIPLCDGVLVHSSNVGLEALILGKPVVVLGNPFYSGRGLTTDVETMTELPAKLCSAFAGSPDKELVHRMLHFLLEDHLIPVGDATRITSRIAEAVEAGPDVRRSLDVLAPRYSERAREYLGTIHSYNVLAKENYSDVEIRQNLSYTVSPDDRRHRASLDSGERQIAYEYANVETDELTRYCLADAMLRPNLRILDIACGVGYGSHLLADSALAVAGVDASDEAIDFANSFWPHRKASFYTASAGRWLARDQANYDAIVSFETIEHMCDASLFLRTAWSRLRPGGVLFLSTPNADFYALTGNAFYVQHFDAEELAQMIRNLPDLEDFRIWPQLGGVVGPNVRSARFLVSAVTKSGNDSALRLGLDEFVPFGIAKMPTRRSFRIGAESFRTNIASKGPKEIISTFAPSDGYIVFGPYHKLLAGQYVVHFEVSVSLQSKPGSGELTLEVINTRDELMARAKLSSEQLLNPEQQAYSLRFHNRNEDLPIEFRIHARGKPISGTLHFKGVNISRLD